MDKVKNAVAGSKGSTVRYGKNHEQPSRHLETWPQEKAVQGVIQRMTKTVKNPYTFMIYTGPEFLFLFSMSWLMIPDNFEESVRTGHL